MDLKGENGASWQDAEFTASTMEPGILVAAVEDDLPTMTVAAIVGVTAFVVIAIVVVFVLGIFIDCRQQRLLDTKMNELRRLRSQRRVVSQTTSDVAGIVANMEEGGSSVPPAAALRNIP